MSYFNNDTIFKISKANELFLKKFVYNEKDTLFYYDMPLMYILSSKEKPEVKFLVYMFSSIDDEVLKYYILEKTTVEVEQYIAQKIDLKTFLSTTLHNRICCVEKIYKDKIEVVPLEEKDLSHTLTLIKENLFYRG